MVCISACSAKYDTAEIEQQPLDLTGDDPGGTQASKLGKIDEQKAIWLTRYLARAGNCRQLTAAGREQMKAVVQPGDHYWGETSGGRPLVDHAHCVDKPDAVPIDDPKFGPIAQTVGDAIRQQKQIEDVFKNDVGDRRWGEGTGFESKAVVCAGTGTKIACQFVE